MNKLLVNDFQAPTSLETDRFRLRMLTINDVIKDYDAVMSSIHHLQKTKPFGLEHKWPTQELTLEQNLIDLGWHQKEFQKNSSFAYTVMSLEENKCLGCMYIYPSSNPKHDAEIIMWVRESEVETGLDQFLYSTVKEWIQDKWPFKNPGYPGRDTSWEDWVSATKLT
jgi:hypothetical protein